MKIGVTGNINEIMERDRGLVFKIKALPKEEELYNPSFQCNNREARRKAEKEYKRRLKKQFKP